MDTRRNAKGASHWSLASDAGMLHYLQEFSHKMISRTHDIQEQMNGLVHEAKLTGVRLNNTVNDFIMLANTQFVENRVYEEDITEEEAGTQDDNKKKLEKTKEERSAALIPRIKDAMALGLQVLDEAFEKIDVNEANSESEDEDAAYVTEAILEPKDPYLSRPLPYLIGTPAFQQSDDIGLVEQPSDDDVSDHGSISESESAASSSSSSEKLNGETGRDRHPSVSSASSSSSEVESESGDLFGGKVSDADEEKELKDEGETEVIDTHQTKADDFASELASRIRTSPPPMNKASKKKKPASNNDDLFAPPSLGIDEDEEDDSPFSHKTGLFSTGGGLFDDNQDEDGLFDEDAQTENKITAASLGQHKGSASDVGRKQTLNYHRNLSMMTFDIV
ncbi:WASH complex subunit 2C [Lamellibrachia satsuma]|nr:WASH complex subunit 2C [Lamellibrachia satsuma]